MHALPLRFVIEEEGLFTTGGARVKRIGRMSASEAIAAVMPVAHGDNEWQKREVAAGYLAIAEVLHARGVSGKLDETGVETEEVGGRGVPSHRHPAAPGVAATGAAPREPWSYRVQGDAVVFEYNEVANRPGETLAEFVARMFDVIEREPVGKLIIDLRNNYGGNGDLNRPLVHAIIRSKKMQKPGSLFVLIGRRTFSAAMMLAMALEQNTNAIFVGEPTGGSPNSHGDSRKLVLPDSGLTVRVSTLYWQTSDPRDGRKALEPHVRTRDPLAVALDYFGAGEPATSWEGVVTVGYQRLPFTLNDGKLSLPYPITFRAGSARLAGTITANGLEYLVTAERR